MANVVEVTDATFKTEVLESPEPVLVDFWAPSCPPCLAIAPVVDQLALRYIGAVKFAKVNTDENRATSTEYGVSAIPTLIFFKNGNAVGSIVGARGKDALASFVDQHR
ncbi:MAG: thioredoxin [Pirellulales bacterium]